MLHELFSYYWNIFKNGRRTVCSPIIDAPYGREELKTNQHWYGYTALALVIGLAIGVCGIWYWGIKGEKKNITPSIVVSFCGYPQIPPPPPLGNPHWLFELRQGTKARFSQYYIPLPSPKKEILETGIRKKLDSKDSQSDVRTTCYDCEFIMPEIPEPEEEVVYPVEPGFSCFHAKDEKPKPVNLDEVTKLITYPDLLQGEGGTVVFRVLIDQNGRYKRHKILKADNSQLLSSIQDHISKLKFTPSIVGGRPKNFWVHVPFVFKALGETVEISDQSKTIVDQAEHLMPTEEQLKAFFSDQMLVDEDLTIDEPIADIEPRIDEFIALDQEPIPLNMHEITKRISYPKLALEAEISGRVILRVLVKKNGLVSRHKVMNEVHPLVANEFVKHMYKLRFQPAMKDDKLVDAWINIPFNVNLLF